MSEEKEIDIERYEQFLENNSIYLEGLKQSKRTGLLFVFNRKMKKLYENYLNAANTEEKLEACSAAIDEYENSFFVRSQTWMEGFVEDIRLFLKRFGRNNVIDNSPKGGKDYYSVVVIVKNAARYMREYILFYEATGADRIYIYDNESTDNLKDVLEPFIKSGLVVYRYWPGKVAQTAAYRDAVRRTKKKTKWLAIVDDDEFLFSPKGQMPEQLKNFEEYPGIGVNWVVFGPNGHDRRPEGLIMDNYTSTIAFQDEGINCHIKSIVQPEWVYTVNQVHSPIYKGSKFAVNEKGEIIGNKYAHVIRAGKAFTYRNNREIFRINHYITKSLEELREKCRRGFGDGAPKGDFNRLLLPFKGPQIYDYSIKPYADIVRKKVRE